MGGGASEFYGPSDNTTFNVKGKRSDSRNLLNEWQEIQTKMNHKHVLLHTNNEFKQTDWEMIINHISYPPFSMDQEVYWMHLDLIQKQRIDSQATTQQNHW
uniref:NAM-associated domain-containing protein n=1 Tax=Schistosoma mansoni TaxID=6183 RepID=A0A3Q0KQL1_SCHMA